MTKRFNSIVRRIMPLLGAGFLFQANGCALDTNALLAGLTTAVVNNLVSSFVFGAFNLTTGP